jgi:hypothetical protein
MEVRDAVFDHHTALTVAGEATAAGQLTCNDRTPPDPTPAEAAAAAPRSTGQRACSQNALKKQARPVAASCPRSA